MSFENSKIAQARTEHEILLEDEKSIKRKKRADKRRRRKYKFSNKHHSTAGIIATICAVVTAALLAISIVLATWAKGNGGELVGFLPLLALLFSTAGIVIAAVSFRKPDTIYTFSWIGLIANAVLWLFVAFIMVIGI